MPAPIVVPIATAIARAIAAQAAKQGVKKLTQSEVKRIASKVAARNATQLSRAGDKVKINPAALGSRVKSGKPKPNRGGGLRTTTGQGKKKTSRADVYEAVRTMRQRPGGSSTTTGTGAIRGTAPKPDVRITTKAGKYRGYGTLSKEKTTVTRPVKRTTNKSGSAITVRKTEPRKASEVKAERKKRNDAKLREALTPRVNPARPKIQPKRGKNERDERTAIDRDEPQGITVRGKFYPDGNRGLMPRGKQPTIESRVASRAEKPTRGKLPSEYDKEAGARIDEAVKASTRVKATVKPGKPTKTTIALRTVGGNKAERTAKLKGTIRNQRKVLKEREIKEAAERIRKAEEAAKKSKEMIIRKSRVK